MKKHKITMCALTAMSFVAVAYSMMELYLTRCKTENPIKIIGGSDGPTSIYLASKVENSNTLYIITIILIVITLIGWILYKRRK